MLDKNDEKILPASFHNVAEQCEFQTESAGNEMQETKQCALANQLIDQCQENQHLVTYFLKNALFENTELQKVTIM